jgi:hypothetical protein
MYKFKSKATGDLIMLGPNGDALLRVLGREPATKGIIEVADMAAARRAIEQALADADAAASAARAEGGDTEREREAVGLRQRLWPMVQMLDRAQAAKEPIVWGV